MIWEGNMPYVTDIYQAYLSSPIDASDVYLPVAHPAYADLLKLLSSATGNYTFLTIKDDTHMETVKAWAEGGYILMERGLEGTEPKKFGYGACVTTISPTIVAVIKDLFCNYSCCGGGTCDCTNVSLVSAELPDGNVGVEWTGVITLGGTIPIEATVKNAPAWMNIVQERTVLNLSGVPTTAGSISLLVEATNCNATARISEALQLVINQ